MPISRSIREEGQIIAPVHLIRRGTLDKKRLVAIVDNTRNPADAGGDFYAQISANRAGLARLGELLSRYGAQAFHSRLAALNDYGECLARGALRTIPDGTPMASKTGWTMTAKDTGISASGSGCKTVPPRSTSGVPRSRYRATSTVRWQWPRRPCSMSSAV